jgi:hypothetical protein
VKANDESQSTGRPKKKRGGGNKRPKISGNTVNKTFRERELITRKFDTCNINILFSLSQKRKSSGSGLENPDYGRRDPSRHVTTELEKSAASGCGC